MIEIDIASTLDPCYADISEFARSVYGAKLHAMITGRPDVFAYARDGESLVGCFGLYYGSTHNPLLFETYFDNGILARIFETAHVQRSSIGELGTRAVLIPNGTVAHTGEVSVALAATLIMRAHRDGIRYLVFTANRTVRGIADALGTIMVPIGEPDLSRKDEEFRKNWKDYFRVKQYCLKINVAQSATGCAHALKLLVDRGGYLLRQPFDEVHTL